MDRIVDVSFNHVTEIGVKMKEEGFLRRKGEMGKSGNPDIWMNVIDL